MFYLISSWNVVSTVMPHFKRGSGFLRSVHIIGNNLIRPSDHSNGKYARSILEMTIAVCALCYPLDHVKLYAILVA